MFLSIWRLLPTAWRLLPTAPLVHHQIQQARQDSSDGFSGGVAQLHQIPTIDCQIFQGKAGVFFLNLPDQAPNFGEIVGFPAVQNPLAAGVCLLEG